MRVTVTKLAIEDGQYFYALGELLVLSGRRNVAINRPMSASSTPNLSSRWALSNLVDGRTALGPPVHIKLLKWDGQFSGPTTTEPFTFMAVDLGRDYPIQEVRLYAAHARLGADIPGFLFPLRFRVEAAQTADFSNAITLLDSSATNYPNPGDNAITIYTPGIITRHVRIALPPGNGDRFGLAEIEVYADDRNVAREKTVSSTVDPGNWRNPWPRSLLVDGFTSYGQLQELPDWLDEWDRRVHLGIELAQLDAQRPGLVDTAWRRLWWTLAVIGGLGAWAMVEWLRLARRRRTRDLEYLRHRLARDLHDEIGSNLAAIARLSELGAVQPTTTDAADWQQVNRIARESTDGLREVLWLAGAREEAGPDLANHLRRLADRLLGGLTVRWGAPLATLPASWSPAARREVFLFAKEALTNIVRHAQATAVDLTLVTDERELRLDIRDDGQGFDPSATGNGIGLTSMRERTRTLGGRLVIDSAPGKGTRMTLHVPLARMQASSGVGSGQ